VVIKSLLFGDAGGREHRGGAAQAKRRTGTMV
jgi:hypothetical protein